MERLLRTEAERLCALEAVHQYAHAAPVGDCEKEIGEIFPSERGLMVCPYLDGLFSTTRCFQE